MAKFITKSKSKKSREIWEGVSRAAKNTPSWVKPQVKIAATTSAHRIVGKANTVTTKKK